MKNETRMRREAKTREGKTLGIKYAKLAVNDFALAKDFFSNQVGLFDYGLEVDDVDMRTKALAAQESFLLHYRHPGHKYPRIHEEIRGFNWRLLR